MARTVLYLIATLLCCCTEIHAESTNNQKDAGGFFDQRKLDRGFFSNPRNSSRAGSTSGAMGKSSAQEPKPMVEIQSVPPGAAASSVVVDSNIQSTRAPLPQEPKLTDRPVLLNGIPARARLIDNQQGNETSVAPKIPKPQRAQKLVTTKPKGQSTVVSLIVSGKRMNHASQQIKKLSLLQRRGVIIGEVFVSQTGELSETIQILQEMRMPHPIPQNSRKDTNYGVSAIGRELNQQGLSKVKILSGEQIQRRLQIRYSPSWVIRHEGRDYVYEGFNNPEMLFDASGIFLHSK